MEERWITVEPLTDDEERKSFVVNSPPGAFSDAFCWNKNALHMEELYLSLLERRTLE